MMLFISLFNPKQSFTPRLQIFVKMPKTYSNLPRRMIISTVKVKFIQTQDKHVQIPQKAVLVYGRVVVMRYAFVVL